MKKKTKSCVAKATNVASESLLFSFQRKTFPLCLPDGLQSFVSQLVVKIKSVSFFNAMEDFTPSP